jgi:selenocysteine lyase/cysteine desulfurase
MCAGPFWHHFMQLNDDQASILRFLSVANPEYDDSQYTAFMKIGAARVNLHYSMKKYEVEYLINAMEYICDHGYKFLPMYYYDFKASQWQH